MILLSRYGVVTVETIGMREWGPISCKKYQVFRAHNIAFNKMNPNSGS